MKALTVGQTVGRGRFGLGNGVRVEAPVGMYLFKLPRGSQSTKAQWGQVDSCYKMKPVFNR